jgi:hypothetical protein
MENLTLNSLFVPSTSDGGYWTERVKPMTTKNLTQGTKYTHPNCNHQCTSNCRRNGCNCFCGEYHGQLTEEEYKEVVSDLNAELTGAEIDSF